MHTKNFAEKPNVKGYFFVLCRLFLDHKLFVEVLICKIHIVYCRVYTHGYVLYDMTIKYVLLHGNATHQLIVMFELRLMYLCI